MPKLEILAMILITGFGIMGFVLISMPRQAKEAVVCYQEKTVDHTYETIRRLYVPCPAIIEANK